MLKLLGYKTVDDLRQAKEWSDHILPMQRLALEQRADPDIQRRLSEPRKQGRPPTIFPLWSEMMLLPVISRDMFIGTKHLPHLFNAPRAKKDHVDRLGFYTDYFFHPLLIVLGHQGRKKIHDRFQFSDTEKATVFILYRQFDNKLDVYLKKQCAEANKGITLAPLEDDEDSDGSEQQRVKRRRRRTHVPSAVAVDGTLADEDVFWNMVANEETKGVILD